MYIIVTQKFEKASKKHQGSETAICDIIETAQ
jgi:hypothetical protein